MNQKDKCRLILGDQELIRGILLLQLRNLKSDEMSYKNNRMNNTNMLYFTADATENELLDLLCETQMMKQIGKHKNIISFIGCCVKNGNLLHSYLLCYV